MSRVQKGKFIVFEGGEGVGKSTQILLLKEALEKSGFKVLITREPGGNAVAERIRNIALDAKSSLASATDLLLFSAARHENIVTNILPNLQSYDFVICDRFILSTLIYQGILGKVNLSLIKLLHKEINFNLYPDITIILKISSKSSISRLVSRKEKNKNDIDDEEFHKAITDHFSNWRDFYEAKTVEIVSEAGVFQLHKQIIDIINKELNIQIISN